MPIFRAKRAYRKRVLVGAAVWLGVCVATGFGVLAATHDGRALPWLMFAGGLGYYLAMIASMIPRAVTIEIERGVITPSWRRAIRNASVELGAWVAAGIDTPMGVVVRVRGDDGDGAVTIGGEGHDGIGYALDGSPARSVDCYVTAVELDDILAALGTRKHAGDGAAITIGLVANRQSSRGVFAMMAPWLATIVVVGAGGGALAASGVLVRWFGEPTATYVQAGITVVLIIAGLVWTMRRSMRVRPAELELRISEHELVLVRARRGGEPVARASWSAVRAVPHRHVASQRAYGEVPALELTLGEHEPLTLAVWDPAHAWAARDGGDAADDSRQIAKLRGAPRWLIGSPQWAHLVAALRAHRRLDA